MGGDTETKETLDQIQAQANNVRLMNYYKASYEPFIKKHISKMTADANSPDQADKAKGQVNAKVMQSVSATSATPPNNPTSLTRTFSSAGTIGAAGQNEAVANIRGRQLGSAQQIVDIGRGQTTTALKEQEALADESLKAAIAQNQSKLETQAAIEDSIGAGVGALAATGKRYFNNTPATDSTAAGGSYGVLQRDAGRPAWDAGGW